MGRDGAGRRGIGGCSTTRRLALVALLLSALLASGCATLGRLYSDAVLNNREHGLPCEELPAADEARAVVAAHRDVVERIEAVNPGQVFVDVDEVCPGRADVAISFGGRDDRRAIEAILAHDTTGDTFFGVPYRLLNR